VDKHAKRDAFVNAWDAEGQYAFRSALTIEGIPHKHIDPCSLLELWESLVAGADNDNWSDAYRLTKLYRNTCIEFSVKLLCEDHAADMFCDPPEQANVKLVNDHPGAKEAGYVGITGIGQEGGCFCSFDVYDPVMRQRIVNCVNAHIGQDPVPDSYSVEQALLSIIGVDLLEQLVAAMKKRGNKAPATLKQLITNQVKSYVDAVNDLHRG
jgi:hypothetical protein